jgi:hypothetical protein
MWEDFASFYHVAQPGGDTWHMEKLCCLAFLLEWQWWMTLSEEGEKKMGEPGEVMGLGGRRVSVALVSVQPELLDTVNLSAAPGCLRGN